MKTLSSPHLVSVIEAHDFGSLLQAVAGAAAHLLGEELAGRPALIVSENESGSGLLIAPHTLHKGRIFRPFRPEGDWFRRVAEAGAGCILAEHPARLLGAAAGESCCPASQARTLAFPISSGVPPSGGTEEVPPKGGTPERCIGFLLLPIGEEVHYLHPDLAEGLGRLAEALGRVLPRILDHELTHHQNQQLQHLYEGMLKTLTAPNKSSLLATLLVVLNRHFGLTRIVIAQVQPETQTLRGELHSGFRPGFAPIAIPMQEVNHPLIQALTRGDVLLYEGEGAEAGEHLAAGLGAERAERRVLLPLLVGLKPIGLIYADQPVHDGTPFFRPVFEIFARLAAAAIENLGLRLRAEQRAESDALTGLYNRYFLDKILELEIPRVKRYNHSISLLMLDLCDFKHFNDTYGHIFGDYILRETANLLQANVRRPDIVVRYGGDEFVVLMVNTTREQAVQVKDRIERAFSERNRMQTDERAVIKVSIGLRSADAQGIETLLHEADMDMYAHKARQTRQSLIAALLEANVEKIETADRVVGSLCNILFKKAPYYPDHARRVAHLAVILARRLGLEEREVETVALAALLHDVGKVSVPTEVLQKTEPLTGAEVAAMRHHPALGEEFFQGLDHLEPVRPIIRSHHERWDGQMAGERPGYPDGLCGERIPLGARVLRLAESAEVMLHGLPYQEPAPPETVLQTIREEAGKIFDPHLVNVLLSDRAWIGILGETQRITELLNLES